MERPPNAALPYREDCWSDGETSALVDAWGDRYVELNRGSLRQQHWQQVADAVNARRRSGGAARRPPRTDVQCKNRIDTLKKKYKAERSKIDFGSAGESQWRFYSRLDTLIGSSAMPAGASKPSPEPAPAPLPPLALPLPYRRKASPLPVAAAVDSKRPRIALPVDNSILRRAAAAAAAAAEEEEDASSSPSMSSSRRNPQKGKGGEAVGIQQLAQAIERLGEVYERVEAAKQRQMMELEKQRMEFAKALEFERMQIFADTQIQLAKLERANRVDAGEQGYSASLPLFLEACRSYMY